MILINDSTHFLTKLDDLSFLFYLYDSLLTHVRPVSHDFKLNKQGEPE